jgi:hypothetical protein
MENVINVTSIPGETSNANESTEGNAPQVQDLKANADRRFPPRQPNQSW